MSSGGRIEYMSNQAADTMHACSDKLWNGFELTADPIESFSSMGALASDPIESFSGEIAQDAPVGAPAHVESFFGRVYV
jgi:hypothetical protein